MIERAGSGSPAYALKGVHASAAAAASAARAKLAELQRASATLRLAITPGNPRIRAETPVSLDGFRAGIPSEWVCGAAIHEINRRGYSTRADLEQAS